MLGEFTFYNPTRLHFGKNALDNLKEELKNYGKNIMLAYGGGSIKKNGIYGQVTDLLQECGKNVYEISGVMPNPTLEKVYEGCRVAKENNVDLILAVGGGSVCDYAKAVSVSTWCEEDPWEKYYMNMEPVSNRVIDVGCILTMVGTGSEMNNTSVITNEAAKLKIGAGFDQRVNPKFSILNPEFTFTLPKYQMTAGIFDIFSHILEQYFSGDDDNVSDYLSEGLMKSLIHSSKIAVDNPKDYEARSNIMWTATWALNSLIGTGKSGDWTAHGIGEAIGAYTDATHGMTLSAVTLPYLKMIMPYGMKRFRRFAVHVWNVDPKGKTDLQIAEEGLQALEKWMKELDLVMNIRDLGVTEDMIDSLSELPWFPDGGYHPLNQEDVKKILKESM